MLRKMYSFSEHVDRVSAQPEDWPDIQFEPDYIYVANRAISSRVNANGDGWSCLELEQGAHTFLNAGVYVEHHNWDASRTRGAVVGYKFHKDTLVNGYPDCWIELLKEVDALAFPKLANAIVNGEITGTSMGADVTTAECSVCGHVATVNDFCEHVTNYKGKYIEIDGKKQLVFEKLGGISFFEDSFVFDPADESAFIGDVFDNRTSKTTSGVSPLTEVYEMQRAARKASLSKVVASSLDRSIK